MTDVTPIGEFRNAFGRETVRLIMRSSFEERSCRLIEALSVATGPHSCLIFASAERSERSTANLLRCRAAAPCAEIVELDRSNALNTALAMQSALRIFLEANHDGRLILDISSFPREELLILLFILQNSGFLYSTAMLAYVGALKMGDRLSGDVVQHRSVVGYAGDMRPSLPTKLVLLLGFELARAKSIIENYEPAEVLIGTPRLGESMSADMRLRAEKLQREISSLHSCPASIFEFSLRDPLKTCLEIHAVIGSFLHQNIVIAPLNTKLSTIGVGLYALSNPSVQICYAAVRDYQEDEYSEPGDNVFYLELGSLIRPNKIPLS